MADKNKYTYSRLADVKPGVHNVFGVVKFYKVPAKSRGTDFVQVLSITDESMPDGEKLVVSLFYNDLKDFPQISIGDILRFHRLQVETVDTGLKGRPGHGFAWLLVHDDVDQPSSSSMKYTYAQSSKDRVLELQRWVQQQAWIEDQPGATPLSGLVASKYYNVVCQVVATAVEEEGTCFVARVWDGTSCQYPVVTKAAEPSQVDHALVEMAADLAVDVWIYDDHFSSCQYIQPGSFIRLSNLHAALYKGEEGNNDCSTSLPSVELIIHRGTSYGRGVVVLEENSREVAQVKQRMTTNLSGNTFEQNNSQDSQKNQAKRAVQRKKETSNRETTERQCGSLKRTPERTGKQGSSARSGTTTDTGTAEAGCSHWTEGNQPAHASLTSTVERSGPSPAKRAGICAESETSCVIVSSSSAEKMPADPLTGYDGLPNDQLNDREDRREWDKTKQTEREKEQANKEDTSGGSSFPDNELRCVLSSSGSGSTGQASQQSSAQTCMLQTASVINGHQHISHTPIRKVLQGSAPNKYRVLAHLVGFHPNTLDPAQFVRQLCHRCSLLRTIPSISHTGSEKESGGCEKKQSVASNITRLAQLIGGRFANWSPAKTPAEKDFDLCPGCQTEGEEVHLDIVFMMRLVLQDSRGDLLVANLWKDQAVTFFRGLRPQVALTSRGAVEEVVETLRSLCLPLNHPSQPSSPTLPPLDCCLLSYNTQAGVKFHIFDTALV